MSNYEVPQPVGNLPYQGPGRPVRDLREAKGADDRSNELLVTKKLSEAEEAT